MSAVIQLSNEQWHQRRRKTLNASEVASVLGLSKFSTENDVYLSKTLDVRKKVGQAAELGHLLQPIICRLAKERLDCRIVSEEQYGVHALDQWAGATLDYVGRDDNDDQFIIECKATRDYRWQTIPENYQLQVAWQCYVHGYSQAYLAVLHQSTTFEMYEFNVRTDAPWLPEVVDACRTWWHRHIVGNEPPDNRNTGEEFLKLIQSQPGKTIELPGSVQADIDDLKRRKAEVKALEESIALQENRIQALIGDAETALINGKVVATWKSTVPKTPKIDMKEVADKKPGIHSMLVEEFGRLPEPSRKFLIK